MVGCRVLFALAFVLALGACGSADVIGGDADGVWVREAMIGDGDPDEVAAAYCARWGKKAVYERTLQIRDHMEVRPTWVYACR